MRPTLDRLILEGYLSELDKQFATTAARLAGDEDPISILGAAVASKFTTMGHVCADISTIAGRPVETSEGEVLKEVEWPELDLWVAALKKSEMVMQSRHPCHRPLVLDEGGQLYLYRYWRYQQDLAEALKSRSSLLAEDVDHKVLKKGLDRMFESEGREKNGSGDEQRIAALTAVLRRLAVIAGGPGTGKTFTVVKILALLLEQAEALGAKRPRILMMAPTGKAAARLTESIRSAKDASKGPGLLCAPSLKAAIPEQATTIHRALGTRIQRPTHFKYHADNPLPADIVVVDEASMIDLPLMTKLLYAVMPTARLILLGDKDQLTSVGAGAILGDICKGDSKTGTIDMVSSAAGWTDNGIGKVDSKKACGMDHCIVHLRHSYRFGPLSGINNLARAINHGEVDQALGYLQDDAQKDVVLIEPPSPLTARGLENTIKGFVSEYQKYLGQTDPQEQLALFGAFRILSPHRRGIVGVDTLNQIVLKILQEGGHVVVDRDWYVGRPVMVTRNDYQIGLFNGDVGVIGQKETGSNDRRVFFADGEKGVRSLVLSRLPPHETVFAMTIHKSQGSEFDRVLVVLPEKDSPVVTRELLYTAVTRARKKVAIVATPKAIRNAIVSTVQRASGLSRALWQA